MIGARVVGSVSVPYWQTVGWGKNPFKTVNSLCLLCDASGYDFVDSSGERLNNLLVRQDLCNVTFKLVAVSRHSLGLQKKSSFEEVCARGEEFRLGPCPNQIPFYVTAQYKNPSEGEQYVFVTESSLLPRTGGAFGQIVFSLGVSNGVRQLVATPSCPTTASKFVFVGQTGVSS